MEAKMGFTETFINYGVSIQHKITSFIPNVGLQALERMGLVDEVVNDPDFVMANDLYLFFAVQLLFKFRTPDDRPSLPIISFSKS